MAPPALPPATVSLMSIDLQREPSDLQALAAVKAELLEETSQSSMISEMSQMDSNATEPMQTSFNLSVTTPTPPTCSKIEQNENLNVVQHSMMVSQQPLCDMIEMQIKQEIARRGSLTPQDKFMIDVENSVTMNQTSNINASAIFPQSVPVTQSDAEKSQMLVDQYQASLVAATSTQLSLQNNAVVPIVSSQDVLMGQDPTTMRSPENIMNTNISPTIMVPPAVHTGLDTVNPLLSTNVLTSDTNSILSVNVPSQPSTISSQASTVVSPSVPMEQEQINIAERTSPVAVKKMILNAAADILSSPDHTSDETRSTINALIALNSEEMLHDSKHNMPSIPPTATHNSLTPTTTTNPTQFSSSSMPGSHLMDNSIR